MPRKIDKIIDDLEVEEKAAIAQGQGAKVLALTRRIEARHTRKVKIELVDGGDLPDTPTIPRSIKKKLRKIKKVFKGGRVLI